MRKWWRNADLVSTYLFWLLRGLSKTLRFRVQKDPEIDPYKPYIFAFWHGKQLLPSFILTKNHFTSLCALVSPSKDGEIIARYLAKCGFDLVRGSSNKRSAAALIDLKKKYASGASIGSSLDGPRGPAFIVKPGFVYLAQKYNIPIIPLGCAYNSSWLFKKAWDQFQLPKPFSSAGMVLGKPYIVPKDMDIDQACDIVTQLIRAADQHAAELISK